MWLCASISLCLLLPAAASAAPESVHVLVMIVDFADVSAPPQLRYRSGGTFSTVPLDVLNSEMVFFTDSASTSARYAELSNGELTVTGDVIEVSIPLMLSTSTSLQFRAAADAEATAQGAVLSNYDRFGYLLSTGFSGQSGTGGAQGDWFWATGLAFNWVNESTPNHELGHTVGLVHANEIQTDGSITTTGDMTDFMGAADAVHTNAVHKDRKGWLLGSRKQTHAMDTANSYVLNALADPADATQVVTVDSHGAHPDIGQPVDTYVSFRTQTGFDQNLTAANDPYGKPLLDTVHVHYGRKDGLSDTYLDRALEAGDVYVTQHATIEVLSIGATSASVSVSQTPYSPSAPTVVVTPVVSDQALAGETLDYTVSVTNNDTGVTFPAFYDQTLTPPGGAWIVNWDSTPKNILVDPGATEVFSTLRVISPVGMAPGVYDVDLELTNNTGSSGPVSTIESFTYEVLPNPDTTPPPPPTGLFGSTYPGSGDDYVVLQWVEPPDTSDVSFYRVYRNGTALGKVASGPLLLDFTFSALVTNAYIVRSVDGAGNESTPTNTAVFGAPDVTPPTAASNLDGSLGASEPLELVLSWDPGTDDTWVEHYEIHRNGMLYGATLPGETTYTDTTPLAWATYTLVAVDASGNKSPASGSWQLAAEIPSLGGPGLVLLGAMLLAAGRTALRRRRPQR